MKRKFLLAAVCAAIAAALITAYGVSASAAPNSITKGVTKENVKIIQQRLKDLKYDCGGVDGIFGPKTEAAVKKFQKAKGLKTDGIVGPKTEAALGITLKSASSPPSASQGNANAVYLLARCVYAEARGEPYTGQVAVAAVVLNRVKNVQFPNTVSGVIYQPYAFTAVADGQINLSPDESAMRAARDALNGWDPTNGCLYYYNPATATSKWIYTLKPELKIGRHTFAKGQY